ERCHRAEAVMGLGEQGGIATGKAGPDLAVFVGAGARGDVVEDDAGGLARLCRPVGVSRGDKIGLALQDHAVVEHLQPVGGKRGPRRGDVDDHLGGAGRGRTFGRAGAFDDAVVDHAVGSKEIARQVDVFGRDPHPPVMLLAESVVTSSRSAMVRTSIQACGTATTTLALPKPSWSINST